MPLLDMGDFALLTSKREADEKVDDGFIIQAIGTRTEGWRNFEYGGFSKINGVVPRQLYRMSNVCR